MKSKPNHNQIPCAMWGIIYYDQVTGPFNLLMCPFPDDTDYMKWHRFVSVPFFIDVYNVPGAPMLFSSKDEAAAYIVNEGLDKFQNTPRPVTVYVYKEVDQ